MRAPWLPLLDWWFGSAESPSEVVKARNTLWFGKKKPTTLKRESALVIRSKRPWRANWPNGRKTPRAGWR